MVGAETGGGIGQAAGDLVKEMQKAQADVQQSDTRRGPNQAFAQALQAQQQTIASQQVAAQVAQKAGIEAQSGRVVNDTTLNKLAKDAQNEKKRVTTQVGATEKDEQSRLGKMVENLIAGQDKMTKIMNMALSGRQFSPSELLAMQAGVYRFSQELDLTSKVVEKATGGIKQTLNTQV